MDGYSVNQSKVLTELAAIVSENAKKEAEAVQGYTKQLEVIACAKEAFAGDEEAMNALEALESATQEKIADELNHSYSLNAEYTELTGIAPKED